MQDGEEQPDATATHREIDTTFAIEIETTTPDKPSKILTNLRKAQEAEQIPIFVVRPGNTRLHWAKRIENILTEPVQTLNAGETRFYTTDSHLQFNGGARKRRGVTAVRPVDGDATEAKNLWFPDGENIVLRDEESNERICVSSLDNLTPDRIPAVYSYDPTVEEYVVHENGERHVYESNSEFRADWIRIKRPFVPADDLSTPYYDEGSYEILILGEGDTPTRVYSNGEVLSLSSLVDRWSSQNTPGGSDISSRNRPSQSSETNTLSSLGGSTLDARNTETEEWKEDPGEVVRRFADEHVREVSYESVQSSILYEVYEEWANEREIRPDSKSWFSRRISNHIDYQRSVEYVDGENVRCLDGITLVGVEE